jgi:Mn-dependent DtxR family transcriptional regulator
MRNGDPYQVLVSRVLTALQRNKLIAIKRDVITLTKTGEKAAQEAKQALFKSV